MATPSWIEDRVSGVVAKVQLRNQLLAAMPVGELEPLLSDLECVPLTPGQALYESGGRITHAFFPATSIVSLLYTMADGATAEVALVGREGVVGLALAMGGDRTSSRASVRTAGNAYRLAAEILKREFNKAGALHGLLLRYTQALLTQMAQTAVCNRYHSVDQQLSRWLLQSLDRLDSIEICMTQELIANTLGVRREGVNEAAGRLQAEGMVQLRHGLITVLNRSRLEQMTCECYGVVRKEFDRLLPGAQPGASSLGP